MESGEPRDYFEVFGLPQTLRLEGAELERRYHALSRALHPDFHQQSLESQKQLSLSRSATLNQAYRTLRDPLSRAEYLLSLHRPGEAKGAEKTETPKSLLMTVFELQEAVEELKDLEADAPAEAREPLRARVREIEAELDEREEGGNETLREIAEAWDALGGASPAAHGEVLDRIAALVNEKAYLKRLRSNIRDALGEGA